MADPIGSATRFLEGVQKDPTVGRALSTGVLGESRARQIPLGGPSFGETLTKALGEVSAAQERSADTLGQFLRGEPVELHQVMAASEEAGIALDMLIEVRNKFTEAYRSLVNIQA
ncbi:MAG: flagellar hook-basal body complex protein FliE [Gemmatimonadaceae bacterium]|nr:flagellar hook-basal body complex protein FliE [Gemmatimonadaceae bacterium]